MSVNANDTFKRSLRLILLEGFHWNDHMLFS